MGFFPLLLGMQKTQRCLQETKGQDVLPRSWKRNEARVQPIFIFYFFFAVGKRKSACFLPQWRVGSSSNDVKINKRKWGDALWWKGQCDLERCVLLMWSLPGGFRDVRSWYLTYPTTLSFEQADLLPVWSLEAENCTKKRSFPWRILSDSRRETWQQPAKERCCP